MKMNKLQSNPVLRKPAIYGELLRRVFFVPGESPYIFSKFNSLYTDTRLMRTTDTSFLPKEQIFIESQPR